MDFSAFQRDFLGIHLRLYIVDFAVVPALGQGLPVAPIRGVRRMRPKPASLIAVPLGAVGDHPFSATRLAERLCHDRSCCPLFLSNADTPPPLMHPNMAGYYREQVSKLRDALDHPDNRTEAADILRTLIDRIELKPVLVEGKKTLAIDLHGHLAGILSLANKAKGGIGEDIAEKCTAMVAGVGFEPTTFRL